MTGAAPASDGTGRTARHDARGDRPDTPGNRRRSRTDQTHNSSYDSDIFRRYQPPKSWIFVRKPYRRSNTTANTRQRIWER